jgi:hypothetical protein
LRHYGKEAEAHDKGEVDIEELESANQIESGTYGGINVG